MLEVGTSLGQMVLIGANPVLSSRQEFIASGLLPNTTYFYRLTSAGANNTGFTYWNTFTTHPYVEPPPVVVSLTGPDPSLVTDEDTPVSFTLVAK
jgi:hypothetical protein